MKTFLKTHWKKILFVLLLLFVGFYCSHHLKNRSIVIGQPNNIILISPEQSQDVIVIGDPDRVNVKPKNKK